MPIGTRPSARDNRDDHELRPLAREGAPVRTDCCRTCGAPITGDRCPYCKTARWPELADPPPEVKLDPDRVIVNVREGTWLVPLRFILDNGLLPSQVARLAEQEHWLQGPFLCDQSRFRLFSFVPLLPTDPDTDLRDAYQADLEFVASGGAC